MKKKLFIVLLISIITGIFIINNIYNNSYSSKIIIVNSKAGNIVSSSNMLSMMLETDYNSGMYEVSSDTSWLKTGYVFNETLSKCSNGGTISYDEDTNTVYFSGVSKDYCYVYFDIIPTIADVCDTEDNLSECIQELYTISGEGTVGLYYFDGTGDYTNANLEAEDYSYRYSGSSDEILNFVCFGSDDCTDTNNLYRIIGIFDDGDGYQVKLIKYDYATSSLLGTDGDYYGTYSETGWDTSYYLGTMDQSSIPTYYWNYNMALTSYINSKYASDWSYSELNTVNLNSNYLTNIGETWSNLISNHTWIVGGNTVSNIYYSATANNAYINEIINTVTTEVASTYEAKVGLMYVSDYAYAADPTYWNTALYSYDSNSGAYAEDWMYMGLNEWTITRLTNQNITYSNYLDTMVCKIYYLGNIFDNTLLSAGAIRPTFYLSPSVQYSSGSGSLNNPIILVTE